MKKRIHLFLSILLIVSLVSMNHSSRILFANYTNKQKIEVPSSRKSIYPSSQILEENYSIVHKNWESISSISPVQIVVNPSDFIENQKYKTEKFQSHGYPVHTLRLNKGSEVSFKVTVNQTGLYNLGFDYYILDQSILPSEGYIKINGQYPFYESRRIIFQDQWESNYNSKKIDRYGNELLPRPSKLQAWQKAFAYDASYLHMQPLQFKLDKGSNKITITNTRGDLLLGKVTIQTPTENIAYISYNSQNKKINLTENKAHLITIEAENIATKNDPSIRVASRTDPSLTPYSTERKLLNILDGQSWNKGGQSVTWSFNVEDSGLYQIDFKYLQNEKYGLPVYREIRVDGEIPFKEMNNYPFNYRNSWENEILSDGAEDYQFYLEKGKHTLTLTVNLSNLRPLAEEITLTMKEINELTLQIQKLTGNNQDSYRDWSITEFLPNLKNQLLSWADSLENHYNYIHSLVRSHEEIGELASLKVAIKQLRKLAENPNELPNQMELFSQGSISVTQILGNLYQLITDSPLTLDKIYIYNHHKLPDPEAGFLTNLSEGMKRFFLSFGDKDYTSTQKNNGVLNVWVNRQRQYVEILQKMIDEDFTPKTGIQVQLSLMPDENKLILANASGNQPDAALGVSNWLPYELAIRGAVKDLRQYHDFDKVVSNFSKGAIIPFIFEDGVYALPETQNFWVTFYRKDILNSLNIPVPDTWEDVVKILPELQRLGMNFYSPISLFRGFKPFVATTPFIYQFGGEMFKDQGMSTAIDSEEALEGIRFMTDLFTIYNLPQDVPNFYHHFRYGSLPIGISDFQTYIQLRTAAPEIANWWGIALHPGVKKGDEVVRWAPAGGQSAMIFEKTKMDKQAWEFLKWWMSSEVQIEFAVQLQMTFGETYMWNTANLKAFEQLPWPEEDKRIILEQFKWVREASRVPGAYMVEREISNVWNKVVFDGGNIRTTIDDSVIRINREIKRKMEEFGYFLNGKMIKPYPVPTIDSVDKWVEKSDN